MSDEAERLKAAVAANADDHDHETTLNLADPASGDEVAHDADNIDGHRIETEGGHSDDREASDVAHSDKHVNSVQQEQSNGAQLVDKNESKPNTPHEGRVTTETTEATSQKLMKPRMALAQQDWCRRKRRGRRNGVSW